MRYYYRLVWTTQSLKDLEDKINELAKEGYRVVATLGELVVIMEKK